jgi:hypothetical protein
VLFAPLLPERPPDPDTAIPFETDSTVPASQPPADSKAANDAVADAKIATRRMGRGLGAREVFCIISASGLGGGLTAKLKLVPRATRSRSASMKGNQERP